MGPGSSVLKSTTRIPASGARVTLCRLGVFVVFIGLYISKSYAIGASRYRVFNLRSSCKKFIRQERAPWWMCATSRNNCS